MQRRDFLHPRHLAQSAGVVASTLAEPAPEPSHELALLRLGWRAMATLFEILLPVGQPDALDAGQATFALLDELEDQLTVYRDHSEVSRLNRLASRRPVSLEPGLFGLLELSAQLTQATQGAFDITTGSLIKAWGGFRGPRRVPSEPERLAALACTGMHQVVLDPQAKSARYLRPGLEINLGSIGKGYALDRLAEFLSETWKISSFLLHGGSSSVYAKGIASDARGWRVRIRHPWHEDSPLGEVWLKNQALGTSAATFQYLEHQGKKLGHVLDPRTGWPAAGIASASVVAPNDALADALSTAFYVGGVELAQRYCATHPDIGAILLPEGSETPIVLGPVVLTHNK